MSGHPGAETAAPPRMPPAGRRGTVIVTTVSSDAHTWNLVYLQLLIQELGYHVVNLGPCVPDDLLVAECGRHAPQMVVVSSVNGHGYQEGLRLVGRLRSEPGLAAVPVVIGGKLGIQGGESERHVADLLDAGFDAVFEERAGGMVSFLNFVASIPRGAARELR
ncbi:cobalamin-dependent protein [Sphaerisporangium sp. TRM90804]|uniref:cobalamin B12-binding domain-containing protein n=1 Tax=Sphaerisporangium sp. TRM90804 TaxID=3031113 RepID=UPI00244C2B1E|nr:cobalamin-dependent protein [Sphaerisporangium sp. TRM90804]MDH2430870.1 cobalamin-dependent protein [Sphaerisporangium sp. TRM90804]